MAKPIASARVDRNRVSKLETLLYIEGYSSPPDFDELGPAILDSVHPGICMDPDCEGSSSQCEPDMRDGWCEECGKNTVESLGSLLGVI